eukprot:TRINITY_DN4973_c0_g1_i3.p1 TRINITY_DN4973_c0_g1~~TRINITY_DN4973_c0_g1_i3.p1  ORF type:complete len:157 (+),score=26.44 TRINITY_DN4973_c0_g1_i3:22-492(+)
MASKDEALRRYRRKLIEHKELAAKLKSMRESAGDLQRKYQKSEDDLNAVQSVGQIIGEVLKQLTEEKFIVKASSGPRYVVACRRGVSTARSCKGLPEAGWNVAQFIVAEPGVRSFLVLVCALSPSDLTFNNLSSTCRPRDGEGCLQLVPIRGFSLR